MACIQQQRWLSPLCNSQLLVLSLPQYGPIWDMIWVTWSYILSHLILWQGDQGKETSLGVSDRHQTSLCVCDAINKGGREPSSIIVPLLKIYLVLTEWVCCCEAPRPSCWRICSHVSIRAHCHLQVPWFLAVTCPVHVSEASNCLQMDWKLSWGTPRSRFMASEII